MARGAGILPAMALHPPAVRYLAVPGRSSLSIVTAMSSAPANRRAVKCPGPSRRGLLTAGLAGLGGLSLVDLLRAEATPAAIRRAVIHVHLDGGPPQMDTIDMKPDGPAEVRGEFSAIATTVPGIQVCELLPGLARLADRFAFLRAVVG